MAIRLQGGFTSVKEGYVYVFNIHDSSYAGTVVPFDLAQDGIIEEYDQEDKGRNQSILTSSVSISLIVKNSSIESLIEDVANAAEGRFFLEVLRDGNKYWYGYILPDQFTLNDLPYGVNPILKIRATDGISRLKDVDYNNAGVSYTGKESFLNHIFNVLGKIDIGGFYGSTESYLTTYIDWWDENHTYSATSDPYSLSRVDHKAFISVDNSGEITYSSAYDVLEQIVQAWGCRFLFSDGTYKLIQINAYKTDAATKVLKVYDKNKGVTTVSTSDFDIWDRKTGILSGFNSGTYECFHNKGNYKYYPALRETQVEYEHFSTDNLIPGNIWTQATAQTATYNDIDHNEGTAALYFSANVSYRADWTTESELQVMTYWFQFQIRVGNYYLRRNYTVDGGKITPGVTEWTTTPSYYNYFPFNYMYSNNSLYSVPIGFPTPPLEESGQLSVTITRAGAYNTAGQQVFTSSSDFTPYYEFTNVSVSLLVDGNVQDQTNVKVYNATNDNGSTNSKKETIKLLIGDGPSGSTFGAIETFNAVSWESSTGWRKGNSGTYEEFGQLLANEILAGQKIAIRRYFGTVTGDFIAHGRLRRYAGETITNYVFIGGRHNLHKDEWNGEWFIIDVDNTGITSETPRKFTDVIRPPFVKNDVPKLPLPGISNPKNEPPVVNYDEDNTTPAAIGINGDFPRNIPIVKFTTFPFFSDGYIYDGDELIVTTPAGEKIPVKVIGDVRPGDTEINIVPITLDVDIPLGSVISLPYDDITSYVQASRIQVKEWYANLAFGGEIFPSNAFIFYRIDEASELYNHKAKNIEAQIYSPGSGAGSYDLVIKRGGSQIESTTISESEEIHRDTLNFEFIAGLYTFHLENVSGSIPFGINISIEYLKPLTTKEFISTTSTIFGEFASDNLAFAGGVSTDQLYNLSIDNQMGWPHGIVVSLFPSTSYPYDSVSQVNDNEWYAVSRGNPYGAPLGAIRSKNYTGTSYVDDLSASVGGVGIGESYVLANGNGWGISGGFVKLRKS